MIRQIQVGPGSVTKTFYDDDDDDDDDGDDRAFLEATRRIARKGREILQCRNSSRGTFHRRLGSSD